MNGPHLLLDVFVPGAPKTKGSVNAKGHGRVEQSVKGSTQWGQLIEYRARQEWNSAPGWQKGLRPPHVGPVRVQLVYFLPVTRARLIRQGSGDIDKLERNVLDALTKAGVYSDDAQVVGCTHEKVATLNDDRTPNSALPNGARILAWAA